MKTLWKVITLSGVVAGVGCILTMPRRATAAPLKVALIGDSYAVGLGPQLAQLLPDFRFEGHVGSNTTQWAHHAAKCEQCGDWVAAFRPDVVLVSLGVNDGTAPSPDSYRAITDKFQKIGSKVVWVEPPAQVTTASRAVIASLGIPTIPGSKVALSADRVHPVSYAGWAAEIARVLRG